MPVLTLEDMLVKVYGANHSRRSLTKAQAELMSIPWPLPHGWILAYHHKELTEDDQQKFLLACSPKMRLEMGLGLVPRKVEVEQKTNQAKGRDFTNCCEETTESKERT